MKNKNRFVYAKKPGIILRPNLESQQKIGSRSSKLYQDCRVPLDIYIDCLFEKEYDRLVINGRATKAEMLEAWEKICVEYSELDNDGHGNELFQKTVELQYLSGKVHTVDKIVRHLQISFNPELLAILKYYGVACGLNPDNWEDQDVRFKKLENVISMAKIWLTEMDILRVTFDELVGQQSGSKGGVEYYEDWLTNISTWRKYSVKECDINVRQFIKAKKSIEKESARLQLLNAS